MNPLLKNVYHLSETIGPRQCGSDNERQAARYIEGKLRSLGIPAERQEFLSIASFSPAQMVIILLSWAGVALLHWLPPLGFLCGAGALCLFILEADTRFSIGQLMPKRQSHNIRGTLNPGRPKRVVITAHMDSSRSGPNFHPKFVKGFRLSFFLLLASLAIVALGAGWSTVRFLQGAPLPSLWIVYAAAVYLLVVFTTLVLREVTGQITPGANDNASGVSVLLETAKTLAGDPPQNLTVEFLATGAEEAGTFGMIHYLDTVGCENRQFINLDNLGSGELFAVTHEGLLWPFAADQALLTAAQEAMLTAPTIPAACRRYHLLTTDASAVLARGGRAVSLMAADSAGILPNWHWPTDTFSNVNSENLIRAKKLTVRMIKILDSKLVAQGDLRRVSGGRQ